ncbi:hypothetical protein JAAARDRAFT_134696 [Jaapia argillacea MUCL 33604]|uniref:S-adenosyl-L-methionine-dependent methyltransferase n=1 Tax=Jaapia argillacea MUCL 33604 TaxID=933084 RepID=A0A067PMF2_9AGAM|nr:hypothetical protein JAAARDRAFT_134696 [Jaapia argillacea MUCL 33604]
MHAIEFYSGIGGLHLALKRCSTPARVVRAFDWDQAACQVYEANHGGKLVNKTDISTLKAPDLTSLKADIWLLSPSCQPYTVLNPQAKGAADPRAKSFLHLIENVLPSLVPLAQHPRYILIENVAGFETSMTRQLLLSVLKQQGYNVIELLLTPLQFGIPNSRLRYYCLAKLSPLVFSNTDGHSDSVWRHIPGQGNDWLDPRLGVSHEVVMDSVDRIQNYIDSDLTDPEAFAIPDRVLQKWGRLFDIVTPSSHRTCCFTRGYTQLVGRAGSILQVNRDLETETVFNTFLNSKTKGSENPVDILRPLQLRYFTPTELLRLFYFLSPRCHQEYAIDTAPSFSWPTGMTNKTKYRLIGNSVNVKIVTELLNYLFL